MNLRGILEKKNLCNFQAFFDGGRTIDSVEWTKLCNCVAHSHATYTILLLERQQFKFLFILLNYNHKHSYKFENFALFPLVFHLFRTHIGRYAVCKLQIVIRLCGIHLFGCWWARAEGWGKMDFTWSIRNWIKYENLYHTIDISCNTCEKHPTLDLFSLDYGYRPFIVVNTTSSQTIKRQRRSINCSPGISECCRDKLYISFAEIGWNDWILHPAGYDAYFCRGSCASAATITSDASNYHIFVRVSFSVHEHFFSMSV